MPSPEEQAPRHLLHRGQIVEIGPPPHLGQRHHGDVVGGLVRACAGSGAGLQDLDRGRRWRRDDRREGDIVAEGRRAFGRVDGACFFGVALWQRWCIDGGEGKRHARGKGGECHCPRILEGGRKAGRPLIPRQ